MITAQEFVSNYLNKINPATGMYWRMDDIERATGTPMDQLTPWLNQAQQTNLRHIEGGGKAPLTNDEILNRWIAGNSYPQLNAPTGSQQPRAQAAGDFVPWQPPLVPPVPRPGGWRDIYGATPWYPRLIPPQVRPPDPDLQPPPGTRPPPGTQPPPTNYPADQVALWNSIQSLIKPHMNDADLRAAGLPENWIENINYYTQWNPFTGYNPLTVQREPNLWVPLDQPPAPRNIPRSNPRDYNLGRGPTRTPPRSPRNQIPMTNPGTYNLGRGQQNLFDPDLWANLSPSTYGGQMPRGQFQPQGSFAPLHFLNRFFQR